MANIREVARLAGVSVATVSRSLSAPEKVSKESLSKVHDAIGQLGYRPNMLARNFRSTRAYAIVVLVPDIANPFFSLLLRALEDGARQRGYAVLLGDTRGAPERELDYINRVEMRLADGIIQLRPGVTDEASLIPAGVACVNACASEQSTGPSIRINNRGAARTMVEYLISLGHKRIGVITGTATDPHTKDRLAGYYEALHAAAIQIDESLIIEGDFTLDSGQHTALQFCQMAERPTAIFSMSDDMAIGAMQTLKAQGVRIPEDMSITGFDDMTYARYCDPGLTTMSQPTELMGNLAMEMLLDIIEGNPVQQDVRILPTELIIRGSTAPASVRFK